MSGKNIIYNDENIKKVIFMKTRNYLRQITLILIKYWSQKKNHMIKKFTYWI